MESCVLFYSRNGNSRYLAQKLAEKVGAAKRIELTEQENRKGLFGFLKAGFQARTGRASHLIGDPWSETADCDRLYLVAPVWAGMPAPALNAFLVQAKLSGKEVIAVTLQADPKTESAPAVFAILQQRVEVAGGIFLAGHALTSTTPGRFAGEEKLDRELEKIAL